MIVLQIEVDGILAVPPKVSGVILVIPKWCESRCSNFGSAVLWHAAIKTPWSALRLS